MPDDSLKININNKAVAQHTYDAIVIGSGISGGWAAKELCEKGLKTLVLERGRNVVHIKDYPTATLAQWEFKHRGSLPEKDKKANPFVSHCYAFDETAMHFFVKDNEHPYIQEKPFDWIRGYQVGGKSLTWGRCTQRWSDFEFTGPRRFNYGWDWPIRYADIAPWYSHVEKFIGVCGTKDGLEAMPDGEFLPPFELNCVEQHLKESIAGNYRGRYLVHARWAHLTQPNPIHIEQGRGKCQARNLCQRGCPFGGYFSSNSSTLPWAEKTGNLTIRPFSVVHSIIYDEQSQQARGVRVIDANTKQAIEFFSRIIFVNGSALNSNLILLNSVSNRFPNGLGNDNGLLGKYICFHNYRGWLGGEIDGFADSYYYGRNPTDAIIANYRNLHKIDTDFLGGYTTYCGAHRERNNDGNGSQQIGAAYKESLAEPGGWRVYAYVQGETIPKEKNHVRLSTDKKDEWGIPQLITSVEYDDNDDKLLNDFFVQTEEMFTKAGAKNIAHSDSKQAPGLDIHEMGGCRMGADPKTSMLDKWNALHHCKNVFVTDGACMASTGNQSPSILYMALTARACDHVVGELKKGNL
ncbi:MAG: GMC family oxidoreductase [Bacteroidetes bacterium]|nr:GMC family oxidoreductase [Bacteroidota bacterium]